MSSNIGKQTIPSITNPNKNYELGKNVRLDTNTIDCLKGMKEDCAAQSGADKVKTVIASTGGFALIGTVICPGPGSAAGALVGLGIGVCVIL